MSRGLQAEERALARANPDPERPESTPAGSLPGVEDQRLNTGGYRVSLPMFEGPLDLLLHLVQKHELDILNIPIAFITERYVEYIQLLDELNIDLASEYLVMAATLVHIKSRMLLPNAPEDESGDGTEEDELDPRAELVRRLLEYQKYKLAAEQLGGRALLGRDVFPRGSSDELAGGEAPLEGIASFKLLDAFQAVLERTQKTREHQIDFERFSLSDKIGELSELLRRRRRLVFHEIFRERASRAELIITFLALLEMTRLRLTRLRQEGPLEPIYIELTVSDDELPPEEAVEEDLAAEQLADEDLAAEDLAAEQLAAEDLRDEAGDAEDFASAQADVRGLAGDGAAAEDTPNAAGDAARGGPFSEEGALQAEELNSGEQVVAEVVVTTVASPEDVDLESSSSDAELTTVELTTVELTTVELTTVELAVDDSEPTAGGFEQRTQVEDGAAEADSEEPVAPLGDPTVAVRTRENDTEDDGAGGGSFEAVRTRVAEEAASDDDAATDLAGGLGIPGATADADGDAVVAAAPDAGERSAAETLVETAGAPADAPTDIPVPAREETTAEAAPGLPHEDDAAAREAPVPGAREEQPAPPASETDPRLAADPREYE